MAQERQRFLMLLKYVCMDVLHMDMKLIMRNIMRK